jgi:hypothetical protein
MTTLMIGRRHKIEASDAAEASAIYCKLRDESGEGASTWPNGRFGKYHISYNGKVWSGKFGDPNRTLVFSPYA